MKKKTANNIVLSLIMIFFTCMPGISCADTQVVKTEYHVKGKTIIEKKYYDNDGRNFYVYSVKEFLDSIKTIMKTRKSVYTKYHSIVWREHSVHEKELPRVRDLFYEYADTIFNLGDSGEYLSNLYFFIYDTGGLIVQSFTSDKDLISKYGYAEKILELLYRLQTFRFSTPVLSGFDKDYYIDSVSWPRRKPAD